VEELLLAVIECDVRQIEMQTAEPNPFEVEITIVKLKKYKSSGSDQIPPEMMV
jgi:hypothetical protein